MKVKVLFIIVFVMSLTTTRTISEIDNVFVKRNQLKKK